MFKIGLSSSGKQLTPELFENYKKAGIECMELTRPQEEYLSTDYHAIKKMADEYGIHLWSFHLPFKPFNKIDISASDKQWRKESVQYLAEILKRGVVSGDIKPFNTHIVDQNGIVRCDGEHWLSAEEIMGMDWLCDNVEGSFPELNELRPESVELAKLLGIKREGASNEDLAAGR